MPIWIRGGDLAIELFDICPQAFHGEDLPTRLVRTGDVRRRGPSFFVHYSWATPLAISEKAAVPLSAATTR
jgi:hypothetical protein